MGSAEILQGTIARQDVRAQRVLDPNIFGEKLGVMASLFGCWHDNISRPFGRGKKTYRACLKCGARTPFDSESFATNGNFYYPPVSEH